MELSGILIHLDAIKTVSNDLKVRDFVVEYIDGVGNAQPVAFSTIGDRCQLLSQFKKGDKLQIRFDIRGREWEEKHRFFVDLRAYTIVLAQPQQAQPLPSQTQTPPVQYQQTPTGPAVDHKMPENAQDDIPF